MPAPPLLTSVAVDPALPVSRQDQIVGQLRAAILGGRLRPGTRLPPSRAWAGELGVARQTVVLAYERLVAEGYLESRVGAGTFVSAVLPETLLTVGPPQRAATRAAPAAAAPEAGRKLSRRGAALRALRVTPAERRLLPLAPGVPALDAFPFAHWERLTTRLWKRRPADLLSYADPAGLPALREAIASYLGTARGIECAPEQVLVVAGSQQGIDLAARVLLDPGDAAWVEDPAYVAARGALAASGVRPVPVAVDAEGLDPALGERLAPAARLALVAPSHQYPLGVTMSLRRRLALLDWAERADAWVLEDDYDSEYRYAGRPLRPLHALADRRAGRVLYLGTFSKVLAPGLRLGYLVVPPDLAAPFTAARALADRHAPAPTQAVLADFIVEGHLAAHVRRMRLLYAERRDALIRSVREEADGVLSADMPECGMHVAARLLIPCDDRAAYREALARGLQTPPLSAFYADPDEAGRQGRRGFLLGFANTPAEAMPDAMRRLRAAVLAAAKT
ncbi:MAG TPA: PLP-dependent aminotransferase family protein [Stellaceae bacterium]